MRNLKLAGCALAALAFCACSRAGDTDASKSGAESDAAPVAAVNDPGAGGAAASGDAFATDVAMSSNGGAAGDASVGAEAGDAQTAPPSGELVVNGVALDAQTRAALSQAYGAVPDGDYWYDPASGLVGVAGGPSSGQILPNLNLGGALQASASGGGQGRLSGVFINGREIHPNEMATLVALFGAVNPGRYWLGPTLVGGYEGGPPMFDLRAAAAQAGRGGNPTGPGYNTNTAFGDLMSDGQCSGYFDPSSGSSVMTGNC